MVTAVAAKVAEELNTPSSPAVETAARGTGRPVSISAMDAVAVLGNGDEGVIVIVPVKGVGRNEPGESVYVSSYGRYRLRGCEAEPVTWLVGL
jgi:hypothetical protein